MPSILKKKKNILQGKLKGLVEKGTWKNPHLKALKNSVTYSKESPYDQLSNKWWVRARIDVNVIREFQDSNGVKYTYNDNIQWR